MVLRLALLTAVSPICGAVLDRSVYPTGHRFHDIEGEHDHERGQPRGHLAGEGLAGV
jgi:hypothetical protein